MSPSLLHRPSSEERFWRWFRANSDRLFHFEAAQAEVFHDLSLALRRVHPSLCFEFGPDRAGVREFIISAEGNKKAFRQVLALARAAPPLPAWVVIPFRPPKDLSVYRRVRYDGLTLSIDDVWFSYENAGTKVDLVLFIRNLDASTEQGLGYASFLLLDMALGEFVVETRVGSIERRPLPPSPSAEGLLPFISILDIVSLPNH